jgi:capsule polysaccharide export protein KpsE/RkpR
MTTTSAPEFCKRIESLIALETTAIRRMEREIVISSTTLKRLQAATPPNLVEIEALKKHLAALQKHLADAERRLEKAIEARTELCNP